MISSISVFSTALCFHAAIPRLYTELRYPKSSKFASKMKKMLRIGIGAASFSCVLYYIVGFFAYMAFGETIAGNLLSNFQQKGYWYLSIVKFAYACVVLLSTPLVVYPSVSTIDRWLFSGERTLSRRFGEAFVWCTVAWALAIAVPQLDVVFGLTGSTGGILIIYVFPSLFYIAVVKRLSKRAPETVHSLVGPSWLFQFAHVLIVVVILLGSISTYSQLLSLIGCSVCWIHDAIFHWGPSVSSPLSEWPSRRTRVSSPSRTGRCLDSCSLRS